MNMRPAMPGVVFAGKKAEFVEDMETRMFRFDLDGMTRSQLVELVFALRDRLEDKHDDNPLPEALAKCDSCGDCPYFADEH